MVMTMITMMTMLTEDNSNLSVLIYLLLEKNSLLSLKFPFLKKRV